jgi:hypothetical protein
MSRRPALFRQADVARALRAVKSAGLVARVEVKPDGTISIVPGTAAPTGESPADALDGWLGGRNAHSA